MKATPKQIDELTRRHPDLTLHGWQYRLSDGGEALDYRPLLLFTDEFLREVNLAADYIEVHGLPTGVGSYRLKHEVEKAAWCYISNGAVIAAALLVGYEALREQRSPNCTFKRLPINPPANVAAIQ